MNDKAYLIIVPKNQRKSPKACVIEATLATTLKHHHTTHSSDLFFS